MGLLDVLQDLPEGGDRGGSMVIEHSGTPPEGAEFRNERSAKEGVTRVFCGVRGRGEILLYELSDYAAMSAGGLMIDWEAIKLDYPGLWLGPVTPGMFAGVRRDAPE